MDLQTFLEYDKALLLALNSDDNLFLSHVALVFTSGLTWIPMYISLLFLVIKNNEKWSRIFLIMGTIAVSMLISNGLNGGFIKPYIGRLRPSFDPSLANSIELVNGYTAEGFSFFSAHACNAFSVAVFFMFLVRSRMLSIFLLCWACVTIWTRMYLGVHFPSDVLVGTIVGTLNATLCYFGYSSVSSRVAPISPYVTDQYTSTGYSLKDIDVVICTIMFTCIYCVIRGVIEAGL